MKQLDADRISEFAGGNSRVALAIGNTFEQHESIAELRDEELFRRLFYQRQGQDDSLMKAAQACALLYSFEGETIEGNDAELPAVAALVGMDAAQLFAKVAELKRRDLVQCRGVWRAILPHAIANRLAAMALRDIPFVLIKRQFNTDRLLRSFSRRISYLHDSVEANRIVMNWLAIDGQLSNLGRLSELGLAIFENIAHIAPEATLAAIETTLYGPDAPEWLKDSRNREYVGRLLRLIAGDASLFERCIEAFVAIVITEPLSDRSQLRQSLEELFHLCYSGTHATLKQRTAVVGHLLRSSNSKRRTLGLSCLKSLLNHGDFWTHHSPDVGARPVDYGYWPRNREEVQHWFGAALHLARRSIANQDVETDSSIRSIVSHSLSEVWFLGPAVQDRLEGIAAEFAAAGYWQEGWIAVRTLLSHLDDDEKADETAVERLQKFEISLRPKNIVEEVRAVVTSENGGAIDYAEMDSGPTFEPEKVRAAREKAFAAAEELGKTVSNDQSAFMALLPDLVRSNASRLVIFGKGLAIGSENQLAIWAQLTQAVIEADDNKRTPDVLGGFLYGISTINQPLCERLLDEALNHEVLGVWFPFLQFSVQITAAGIERLKQAVELGRAPASAFRILGYRQDVTDSDLLAMLLPLAKEKDGFKVAVDILAIRFHTDQSQEHATPHELIAAGRDLLSAPDLSRRNNSYDYELTTIAKICLVGGDGATATRSLCEHIQQAVSNREFRVYDYDQLLSAIFEIHPRIALDAFLGGELQSDGSAGALLDIDGFSLHRRNLLDNASVKEVIAWCDEKPAERYPTIARVASYQASASEGGFTWTPIAKEILKRASDPVAILEIFVARFSPRSWSGSRAAVVESRLGLLDNIGEFNNPALDHYVAEIRPQLLNQTAQMRIYEDERDSVRDERFE